MSAITDAHREALRRASTREYLGDRERAAIAEAYRELTERDQRRPSDEAGTSDRIVERVRTEWPTYRDLHRLDWHGDSALVEFAVHIALSMVQRAEDAHRDEVERLREVEAGVQRLRARMAREADSPNPERRYLWVREIVDLLSGKLT